MRLINTKEVLHMLGCSRSTLYKMIKAGDFPQPIITGKRVRRWRDTDIEDWIASR